MREVDVPGAGADGHLGGAGRVARQPAEARRDHHHLVPVRVHVTEVLRESLGDAVVVGRGDAVGGRDVAVLEVAPAQAGDHLAGTREDHAFDVVLAGGLQDVKDAHDVVGQNLRHEVRIVGDGAEMDDGVNGSGGRRSGDGAVDGRGVGDGAGVRIG